MSPSDGGGAPPPPDSPPPDPPPLPPPPPPSSSLSSPSSSARAAGLHAGSLGITASSGPGVALKTEALGLAIATELPLSHKAQLRNFVEHIDNLADRSEDVADRLAIYTIKRTV